MGQGSSRIFNIISIVFLTLSVFWIVFVVTRLAGPTPAPAGLVIPTAASLPTLGPSATQDSALVGLAGAPTVPPTFTATIPPSLTPSSTPTTTPSLAPSATITETPGPTATPTVTETPAASATPTATETPLGPTAVPTATISPFPFAQRDQQVLFTQNFANTAGCAWQGVAGQVFDQNGQPLQQVQVHIFGAGLDRFVQSGTNTTYGPAGYEQPVDNKINANTYFVELQTSAGTAISPAVQVVFPNNCSQNLALVNFIQTRPLTGQPSAGVPTATPDTANFPFELRDQQVLFTQNFSNQAGCAWQGVGGQVFDLNGQPLQQVQVRITGNGLDSFVISGTNPLYGPAGFEQQVGQAIGAASYTVELRDLSGNVLSPPVTVTFPGDCAQNLALINFIQLRPF